MTQLPFNESNTLSASREIRHFIMSFYCNQSYYQIKLDSREGEVDMALEMLVGNSLMSIISVDHLHPKYTSFPILIEYDIVGLVKQVPCVDSAAPEAEAETSLPELRRTETRPPHGRHGQEGDGRED